MATEKEKVQHSASAKSPSQASEDARKGRAPSFLQVIQSTLAAAFGVQTEKARQRDFQHGRPLPFIVAGVVFTILFVVVLIVVVTIVLDRAGV